MTIDEVVAVAEAGAAQGCTEVLLTLGEWRLLSANLHVCFQRTQTETK